MRWNLLISLAYTLELLQKRKSGVFMKKLFFIFLLQITILLLVACSGAGGLALFRYKSEGNIYDYSSIGESEPYTMTQNEPLSILQGSTERQWFNTKFNEFKNVSSFPFDQHFLAGLCSTNDRYLFIITAYNIATNSFMELPQRTTYQSLQLHYMKKLPTKTVPWMNYF